MYYTYYIHCKYTYYTDTQTDKEERRGEYLLRIPASEMRKRGYWADS